MSWLRSSAATALPPWRGTPKPAIAHEGRNIQFRMSPLNFIVELKEHPEHEPVFSKLARALRANSPR
jgi:hypothetical protein